MAMGSAPFMGCRPPSSESSPMMMYLSRFFVSYLPGTGKYADRDGKIVCRPFLPDVSRRHIHYYFLPRHAEVIGLQGSFYTLH